MKQLYLLLMLFALFSLEGCKDDGEMSFPASSSPEIVVERNDLYSNPNRKFIIKADLKDDLGLKSLKISIPEFYLDKEITFPTDDLLTEYKLAYEFLAPADTKEIETYKVNLVLTDVSGNSVAKELTLHLDGDFNVPVFSDVKPVDGMVKILGEDMSLEVSFTVADDTGLDSVIVEEKKLGIKERIKLNGEKEYIFSKTYSLPSEPAKYELSIAAIDNFIEPNKAVQKLGFSVSSEMVTLFLADVPKDADLQEDIFGVPMYYHEKKDGVFKFRYYADTDNKEIYFLGQETAFEPHCFGKASEDGKLINSITAEPIILPTKGYYELAADTKNMTYEVTAYTPTSSVWNPTNITICGNGMELGGWNPNNTDLLLAANPDNPYILERDLNLTGTDIAMTITSPNWGNPFWRLDANATIVYMGGGNFTYPNTKTGTYKYKMDTEIGRAVLIKE